MIAAYHPDGTMTHVTGMQIRSDLVLTAAHIKTSPEPKFRIFHTGGTIGSNEVEYAWDSLAPDSDTHGYAGGLDIALLRVAGMPEVPSLPLAVIAADLPIRTECFGYCFPRFEKRQLEGDLSKAARSEHISGWLMSGGWPLDSSNTSSDTWSRKLHLTTHGPAPQKGKITASMELWAGASGAAIRTLEDGTEYCIGVISHQEPHDSEQVLRVAHFHDLLQAALHPGKAATFPVSSDRAREFWKIVGQDPHKVPQLRGTHADENEELFLIHTEADQQWAWWAADTLRRSTLRTNVTLIPTSEDPLAKKLYGKTIRVTSSATSGGGPGIGRTEELTPDTGDHCENDGECPQDLCKTLVVSVDTGNLTKVGHGIVADIACLRGKSPELSIIVLLRALEDVYGITIAVGSRELDATQDLHDIWTWPRTRRIDRRKQEPFVPQREESLSSTQRALRQGHTPRHISLVCGAPGNGKSALATEFILTNQHRYRTVWWVPCEDLIDAQRSIRSLAAATNVEQPDFDTLLSVLWPRVQQPWLIVFDNVDDPDEEYVRAVEKMIPPEDLEGNVIITTRQSQIIAERFNIEPKRIVSLGPLSDAEGGAALISMVDNPRDSVAPAISAECSSALSEVACQISRELGGLLLVLDVAAQLVRAGEHPRELLSRIRARADGILDETTERVGPSLRQVFNIAISRLTRVSAPATQLVFMLGLLGPDNIPVKLLGSVGEILPLELSYALPDETDKLLLTLHNSALISWDRESLDLDIHRLSGVYLVSALREDAKSGTGTAVPTLMVWGMIEMCWRFCRGEMRGGPSTAEGEVGNNFWLSSEGLPFDSKSVEVLHSHIVHLGKNIVFLHPYIQLDDVAESHLFELIRMTVIYSHKVGAYKVAMSVLDVLEAFLATRSTPHDARRLALTILLRAENLFRQGEVRDALDVLGHIDSQRHALQEWEEFNFNLLCSMIELEVPNVGAAQARAATALAWAKTRRQPARVDVCSALNRAGVAAWRAGSLEKAQMYFGDMLTYSDGLAETSPGLLMEMCKHVALIQRDVGLVLHDSSFRKLCSDLLDKSIEIGELQLGRVPEVSRLYKERGELGLWFQPVSTAIVSKSTVDIKVARDHAAREGTSIDQHPNGAGLLRAEALLDLRSGRALQAAGKARTALDTFRALGNGFYVGESLIIYADASMQLGRIGEGLVALCEARQIFDDLLGRDYPLSSVIRRISSAIPECLLTPKMSEQRRQVVAASSLSADYLDSARNAGTSGRVFLEALAQRGV